MKNVYLIFIGGLAFLCVFLFLSKGCSDRKHDKELAVKDQIIFDCVNAPVTSTTVEVPIYIPDTIYLPSSFKVKRTVKESEAVDWENHTIEQRFYSGIYTHPQFEIHWSADVTGTLDRITINPPTLIKSLIITKEKTVDLTKYQECPKNEKSHIYTTFGTTFTFKEVQAIDLGLQYIRKEGWGLRAGIATDFEQLNYTAGVIIKLK